jgi:thiol-disulfide isomerase/thioredoxin
MSTSPNSTGPNPSRMPMTRLLLIAALLGAAAGLAAVYGIGALKRNGTGGMADSACNGAVNAARKLDPLAKGEVAALAPATAPRRVPELSFLDGTGKPVKLSDFRGRTVLINLWATWCVPCRKEMPALDELEAKLGGADFTVLAINIDTGDRGKPRKFLNEIGIKKLAYYEDPQAGVFQELKRVGRVVGLPTSILVDRQGCELGVLSGPAEWASEDALALIRAAK